MAPSDLLGQIKLFFGRSLMTKEIERWSDAHGYALMITGSKLTIKPARDAGLLVWEVTLGKSTHPFIPGLELRGIAKLSLRHSPSIVLINRTFKDELESDFYSRTTQDLHTGLHGSVPEEVLWLAGCFEVGWDGPPDQFWRSWAVLADDRTDARQWLSSPLQRHIGQWLQGRTQAADPFVLALQNGRVYLRARHTSQAGLERAVQMFLEACETAMQLLTERRSPGSPL